MIPFQESYGPLLDKHGRPIPFGPLLRVRATLDHGIHQLSWTACQPISLVWDYQHWGGRLTVCEQANMLPGDTVRSLSFDRALPPNLLQAWIDFLNSAKQRDLANSDRDRLVIASLPIFHHPRIRAPMRILNQEEVQRLAGLHDHFDKVSAFKSYLTELSVRNYCGNSFHPEYIQAAVGHAERLRQWLTPSPEQHTDISVLHPKQVTDLDAKAENRRF